MPYDFSPVVSELIQRQLASGRYVSEDAVLLDALRSLEAEQEDLRAIQEGIDPREGGDEGISLDETFRKPR